MNCSSCGMQTESDQKFCRSCGKSLNASVERTTNPGLRLFRLGLVTIFASLIIAVTGGMLLHADIVIYFGVIGNFIGMFMVGYSSIGSSLPMKRSRPAADYQELVKAETTKKLRPVNEGEFIPSVTESTTNLLETPVSKIR